MNYKKITSGAEGPDVLLTAGVHGDEYEPMLATLELLAELPGKLTRGTVTIVSIVNEGAYESAARYGTDGLDLARICPGNELGTSSETAAAEISKLIESSDYLVDMHTGGVMYDIAPLAGYMLHPSTDILEKQRKMAGSFNLPIIWGTEHRPDGRTLSVARDAGVPAIYLEYGGGTGIRGKVTEAYKSGFLNLLASLGMVEAQSVTEPLENRFWVEDYRYNSGYLQGKMPSPADGIFIAEVTLGEMVEKGQRWGKIVDVLEGTVVEVFADMAGLAFLQRALVKVKKGDALGGILPIEKPGKTVIYE
ncbi:N-alpha-acetyl-L-2,4-diaminobutyric acid deacetylase [Dyadobacter sp. CECT 9275]|uniref:N-alpha-acetyl-L-2,4-diaminobutyric acid deacetylase n=1 Tax=Dyadobacter helix TaxID=2822344 RepID=A0A916JJ97_9BACT|nr:M14 family metallopeptidase [Dyadobacter sp. CECT 9275]CAG5018556.1 N-alpha-acetyl-L-2,4-diaminobutyric acid deacetylase [Dyadobacter sp. CECT 9275]